MRRSEARPSVALLSSQVWTLTESRHKQGAVKHFDSFRKRPIHSNQGKQLQRRKFTSLPLSLSLLRFAGKKKEGKSLGLRRCVTVCQHVNRVLSLLFSVLPFFSSYVVTDRRQAAQQHGWFFWVFLSFFFLSCGVRGKRGMGLEGEGERLCGVPKRSRGTRWWCGATSTPGLEHGGGPWGLNGWRSSRRACCAVGGRESIFLVLLNTKLKILKLIKKRINHFFKIIFLAIYMNKNDFYSNQENAP